MKIQSLVLGLLLVDLIDLATIFGCFYFFVGGFFARITYRHHRLRDASATYALFCGFGAAALWPVSFVLGVRHGIALLRGDKERQCE